MSDDVLEELESLGAIYGAALTVQYDQTRSVQLSLRGAGTGSRDLLLSLDLPAEYPSAAPFLRELGGLSRSGHAAALCAARSCISSHSNSPKVAKWQR